MARTDCFDKGADPISESAIAHLIVVLDKGHKGNRRQSPAWFTARVAAITHQFALKREAFGKSSPQFFRVARIIRVIPGALSGGGCVQDVMHIVVPLGRKLNRIPNRITCQPGGLVLFVL